MDVSITGTALNHQTLVPSPFVMSFSINGGTFIAAPQCDSALMNASVTNFAVEVGNNVQALPHAFAANVTTTEYPCPNSGSIYGELVGGPLTLESQGALFVQHSRLFDGNIGSWYIETAQLEILSAVPEPGGLPLLFAVAVAALLAQSWRRVKMLRA